jgi:predicted alpha-1,2-mannosidase
MKKIIIAFIYFFTLHIVTAQVRKPVDYVDPLIGTENEGSTFPGPAMPFGIVKLSPDCYKDARQNSNPGYTTGAPVYGFSHTHVSGTGGGPKYGNILVMPLTGSVNVKDRSSAISNEVAEAGYYSCVLNKYNIKAELTCTRSVGVHRYTFPSTNDGHLLIDAGAYLFNGGEVQYPVNSAVKIISNTEVCGYGRVRGGWNKGDPYTVFFYAKLSQPAKSYGIWRDDHVMYNATEHKPIRDLDYSDAGAFFDFDSTAKRQLVVKVGISFISIEKAKQNLESEAGEKTFDEVVAYNKNQWNTQLSKIEVEGGTEDQRKMFYTGLYHVMLMPSDRTGENPLWKSDAPYYDDYYAIWDTYRTSNPLLTLISAQRETDLINSLIDIYKHEGYMPDARAGNYSGLTQGGSNADVLIADAYAKGLKGIDYEEAYKAMIKNAEVQPLNDLKEGRGGLEEYKSLGYVPDNIKRAGSRTVEYAYNDWCIAQVAKGLGKMDDYSKYMQRSGNWQNLWRPISDHGATGFIWPRKKDGSWNDDYSFFVVGSWNDFMYESHTWEYSFYAPHDIKTLVEKCGGQKAFISRLDTFFTNKYYRVANEPGFLTPMLYSYAGRYDKTASTVRNIIRNSYKASRGGIPGNDDSGAMSAWFIFHAMGFFPNAGQNIYLLSSPIFPKTTIHMDNGKDIIINAKNTSEKNIYIQSAKINGKKLSNPWFTHDDVKNGASVDLIMGDKNAAWSK